MPPRDVSKLAFDLIADCVQLKRLWLGVDKDTAHRTRIPYKYLLVMRNWGAFDAATGLRSVDIKFKELAHWGLEGSRDPEEHFQKETPRVKSAKGARRSN